MLHMNLMVNNQQIGYLRARRITPGQPADDDVCTYNWWINLNGRTDSNIAPLPHRYGDGAWTLIAAVLAAAADQADLDQDGA